MSTTSNPPPAGPTVKVTFDPSATPQFTFKPNTVRVKGGPQTVVLSQSSPPAAWDFVTALVKDDTLKQFSSSVHGNGKILHIEDALKDPDLEAYSYNITVKLNGTEYTSPDPHIVNDPP